MKICMLSTMYLRHKHDTRGLMVSEINKNLLKNNIKVLIVAPNDYNYQNFEIIDKVEINRFNYFWPKKFQKLAYGSGIPTNLRKSYLTKFQVPFFSLLFLLKTLKVAKKCDIIHAQWLFSGFIGLLAKKIIRKPVVVTVRRVNNNSLMKYINKYVLKNADYIIFNSTYTQKQSLKITKPKQFSVIHNSIDLDKFKLIKTDLRKKLHLENKKILFTMGLLVEKKGLEYLIKAIPCVLKKHQNTVLLIGGHGKEEQKLKNLVKKLNLKNKIFFIGEILANETPLYFNICDIFILPSIVDSKGETETLGMVLIEAMACGKPVIASNVGGIPDVISDEGILVEEKKPEQLSKQINHLLNNPKLKKELGQRARKRIKSNFESKKIMGKLIEIYKSLIN